MSDHLPNELLLTYMRKIQDKADLSELGEIEGLCCAVRAVILLAASEDDFIATMIGLGRLIETDSNFFKDMYREMLTWEPGQADEGEAVAFDPFDPSTYGDV